jgi:hypothetical protein
LEVISGSLATQRAGRVERFTAERVDHGSRAAAGGRRATECDEARRIREKFLMTRGRAEIVGFPVELCLAVGLRRIYRHRAYGID